MDCTSCEKVLVNGSRANSWAKTLGIEPGQSRHGESGHLVAAIAPEQWLCLSDPGVGFSIRDVAADGDSVRPLATVTSVTHANALMRLIGIDSAKVLGKLCSVNFDDVTIPNYSTLRTSIARIVVSLIRDDLAAAVGTHHDEPVRSYLIMCDRSAGQYVFNVLFEAGQEFGIDVQGFACGGVSLISV
jgi:heterotetrameric sarcosine oxidase gamma subunit